MEKEDLIFLLKSKESIAEFFNDNNNNYNNEISDILPKKLRDILSKKDRKEIKDKLYKNRSPKKYFRSRKRKK